jgi:transposase
MHDWQTQSRERLGLEIAALSKIDKRGAVWLVPSQSGKGRYTVSLDPSEPYCSCADFEEHQERCKHLYAVEFVMRREQNGDGTETITKTMTLTERVKRPTYRQDWAAYNAAQVNEKREFQALLYDLCQNNLPPVKRGRGRPSLPMSDAIFAAVMKIFSTVSARRFVGDLDEAHERGYLTRLPHYNSIANYLEKEELEPILLDLIHTTSLPLKAVEVDFAVDSTGFTGKSYTRWFDHKYRGKREHHWVKAHLMCGVKTNIVTACEIHSRDASDAVQLRSLLEMTSQHFDVREVSADKAYGVVYNHQAIADAGAKAFIPFKSSHNGAAGGIWEDAFHFWNLHRQEFNEHYHKRSNVESTVWMIKSKFGGHVRCKTETAMKMRFIARYCATISAALFSQYMNLVLRRSFLRPKSRGDRFSFPRHRPVRAVVPDFRCSRPTRGNSASHDGVEGVVNDRLHAPVCG